MTYTIEVVEERSKSRTGRHVLRKIIYLYIRDKGLIPLTKAVERIKNTGNAEKTYSKGYARRYIVELDHGDYLIEARFVKNFLGKVKGEIKIYNYKGELVYKAKYIDGEIRKSTGSHIYEWLLHLFLETLRIPVKKWIGVKNA